MLSLRARLNLFVAAIVASVIGIEAWLGMRVLKREGESDLRGVAELTAEAVADNLRVRDEPTSEDAIAPMLRDFLMTAPDLALRNIFGIKLGDETAS